MKPSIFDFITQSSQPIETASTEKHIFVIGSSPSSVANVINSLLGAPPSNSNVPSFGLKVHSFNLLTESQSFTLYLYPFDMSPTSVSILNLLLTSDAYDDLIVFFVLNWNNPSQLLDEIDQLTRLLGTAIQKNVPKQQIERTTSKYEAFLVQCYSNFPQKTNHSEEFTERSLPPKVLRLNLGIPVVMIIDTTKSSKPPFSGPVLPQLNLDSLPDPYLHSANQPVSFGDQTRRESMKLCESLYLAHLRAAVLQCGGSACVSEQKNLVTMLEMLLTSSLASIKDTVEDMISLNLISLFVPFGTDSRSYLADTIPESAVRASPSQPPSQHRYSRQQEEDDDEPHRQTQNQHPPHFWDPAFYQREMSVWDKVPKQTEDPLPPLSKEETYTQLRHLQSSSHHTRSFASDVPGSSEIRHEMESLTVDQRKRPRDWDDTLDRTSTEKRKRLIEEKPMERKPSLPVQSAVTQAIQRIIPGQNPLRTNVRPKRTGGPPQTGPTVMSASAKAISMLRKPK
ncbi:hypothetical protein BLNAU_3609 [Blattamonas nauphoetae]|uniref:Uncharacterized protein n=1 Tax=Blattamonas nauphoetae TaxID=2049346 RepID=A0ABQ9YCJ3_9EUKA|nr:hypothetical protein BLNAU_3609 [Blattamonas nauphoetae]